MIHLCGSGLGQKGSTRHVGGACARDAGPPSSIQAAHTIIVTTSTFARLVGSCIELLPCCRAKEYRNADNSAMNNAQPVKGSASPRV